jgi:hypothetical protein
MEEEDTQPDKYESEEQEIDRKDSDGPAPVKLPEVETAAFRVEQNSGDQKARQDEEQVYTDPSGIEDPTEALFESSAMTEYLAVMREHHQDDGDAAHSIQGRKMGA